MGKLVLFLADGTMLDVPLDRERITIGRRADNDVCLPYPAVSGEHAAVVTILADSFLEDLGSTNGTLVNGRPAQKHFLRDHDQIDIGRQRMTYMSDDDARVEPLPADALRQQIRGLTDLVTPVPPTVATGGAPRAPAVSAASAPLLADLERHMSGEGGEPGGAAPAPASRHEPAGHPPARKSPAGSGPPRIPQAGIPSAGSDSVANASARNASAASPSAANPSTMAVRAGPRREWHGERRSAVVSTEGAAPPVPEPERAVPADAPPSEPAAPAHPVVRVLSGASLGRSMPMHKDELSVGRAGVQVALIRKVSGGFRLVPFEGNLPPRINGAAVPAEGAPLHPGDTFEVAGVRLELSLPG